MEQKRRRPGRNSGSSGYSHHRRSRRKSRRFSWLRHHKTQALISAGIILLVFAVFGYGIYRIAEGQKSRHVTAGNAYNMGSSYRNITYNGKKYQYNELITTVLYAGIDSDDALKPNDTCMTGARSDSIALVVLDKKRSKMTIIPINRDTMTEVTRYQINGRVDAVITTHLALAYAFGDGGEISCNNLREAVSNLLGGIPVNEYVITNRSSIPYMNEIVGGVALEVPNNDVVAMHPELAQGAKIKLDGSNVYDYLHYRDTTVDYSNEGRMERQEAYATAYVQVFQEQLEQDLDGLWKRIEGLDQNMQTSITKNKYITMANLISQINFTDNDYLHIQGEDVRGSTYDEFYADEDALQAMVIDLFYEEI